MDCLNESTRSNASALHGLYTDFDGWVINFERCYRDRSTYFIKEIRRSDETNYIAKNKMTNDKNHIAGLINLQNLHNIEMPLSKNNIWSAILNVNDSNNYINLDYVLIRLVRDSFLFQYTKSKL